MRRDLGLTIGRNVTFDIQGERVTARIANVRRVDWPNARLGFMIEFRPGSLGDIPMMYIGAARGPDDSTERGRLSRSLADAHPNVSVIDARDIIATIARVLSSVAFAIAIIGGIVLLAGLLILSGAIAMARYVREYETAVMKTLGAGSRTLLGILLTEHSLLGSL